MLPTSKAHLWDAQHACATAVSFVEGQDEEAFKESVLLQSAVERQIEIFGEALARLRRTDPEVAALIPEANRIIGMRNVIAHEYGVVDYAIVWSVVTARLGPLAERLETLLQA